MSLNILFTTTAHSEGGRNGHTRSQDGLVDVNLSVPKPMGGPGKAGSTTPEDLFAAGYAACFGGAVDYVAENMLKLKPTKVAVDCAVSFGTDASNGFGLQVDMTVGVSGLSQADAEKLVTTAHTVCPYSKATRGNIDVNLKTIVV